MKSKGNGTPQQCISNLLKIARFEVPYARLKGIDPTLIDAPAAAAGPRFLDEVGWMLRTFEDRAKIERTQLAQYAAETGNFQLDVDAIILKGGA